MATLRTRVPDDGRLDAPLVLIGEAPGAQELRAGRPFTGPAGATLRRWWEPLDLARDDFYIMNVYPYVCPGAKIARAPRAEVEEWAATLHARLCRLTAPRLIVPVGNVALRALLGQPLWANSSASIGDWRGSIMRVRLADGRKVKCIPTHHPTATFQDRQLVKLCVADWTRINEDRHFTALAHPRWTRYIPGTTPAGVIDRYLEAARDPRTVMAVDIECPRRGGKWVLQCVGFSYLVNTDDPYRVTGESLTLAWPEQARTIAALCESTCAKVGQNFCVPGSVEVLTPLGWRRLDRCAPTETVAQWDNGRIHFANAALITVENAQRWTAKTRDHWCSYTGNHRLVYRPKHGTKWLVGEARNVCKLDRITIPTAGKMQDSPTQTTIPYLLLLVAIQADAHLIPSAARFNLKKSRKIKRLQNLCEQYGVCLEEGTRSMPGERTFVIKGICARTAWKYLGHLKEWGPYLLTLGLVERQTFLAELAYWDGCHVGRGLTYFSHVQGNLEWACAVASVSGWSSRMRPVQDHAVFLTPRSETIIKRKDWQQSPSRGFMYCLKTDTGFFLARSHGRTFITGNCFDRFWLYPPSGYADLAPIHWQTRKLPRIKMGGRIYDLLSMHHQLFSTLPHDLATQASLYTRQPYWKRSWKESSAQSDDREPFERLCLYNGVDCCTSRALYNVYRERLSEPV